MKRFSNNDTVQVGRSKRIPLRYQGRLGRVVGRKGSGTGTRYLVDFGARRVMPLPVAPSQLTLSI